MKLIDVKNYDCIICDGEGDEIVIYGVKQGRVIERHVIPDLSIHEAGTSPPPSTFVSSRQIVTTIILLFIALLAIIALLLGYPDIARDIISLLSG